MSILLGLFDLFISEAVCVCVEACAYVVRFRCVSCVFARSFYSSVVIYSASHVLARRTISLRFLANIGGCRNIRLTANMRSISTSRSTLCLSLLWIHQFHQISICMRACVCVYVSFVLTTDQYTLIEISLFLMFYSPWVPTFASMKDKLRYSLDSLG